MLLGWARKIDALSRPGSRTANREACAAPGVQYFEHMIVTENELANGSKRVLDRVIHDGEVVEVQRLGRTVAEIRPRVGVSRTEVLRLLSDRGFTEGDQQQLQAAMDAASAVIGYAGCD